MNAPIDNPVVLREIFAHRVYKDAVRLILTSMISGRWSEVTRAPVLFCLCSRLYCRRTSNFDLGFGHHVIE